MKQPTAERRKSTRPFFSSIMKGSKIVKKSCLHNQPHTGLCCEGFQGDQEAMLAQLHTVLGQVCSVINQPCLHNSSLRYQGL